jgi:hypothetical protein
MYADRFALSLTRQLASPWNASHASGDLMTINSIADEIAKARLEGIVAGLSLMSQALPDEAARDALRSVQATIRREVVILEGLYWPQVIAASSPGERRVAASLAARISFHEELGDALHPLFAEVAASPSA